MTPKDKVESLVLTILDEGNFEEEIHRNLESKLEYLEDLNVDKDLKESLKEKIKDLMEDTEKHSSKIDSLMEKMAKYKDPGAEVDDLLVLVLEIIEKEVMAKTIYKITADLTTDPELKNIALELAKEEEKHRNKIESFLHTIITRRLQK